MARTKNRFNAVQIPEPATADIPAKQRKSFRVALYARLSVELKSRPSESIANQLSILREFIRDKAEFIEYQEYVDSAVSGTSFDRPAFGQMMDDVREGKISCIIVKDMSRFGRDYIEASNYIETIFPFLGVRFISVSDHFDTEAEFNQNKALEIALKNLVNDMYAKDISKRVSVSRRLDMERGKFTGSNAPYGYKVDSGDALRKYVIDRAAAAVVRQIFELAADGVTLREIAKALQEYRIALPGDYLKTGNLYVEEGAEAKAWYPGTISNILKNQAYIGNMVQGKQERISYKVKQRLDKPESEWVKVENTHPAIIRQNDFDVVQKLLQYDGRASKTSDSANFFSGFVFCGDCKTPMIRRVNQYKGKKKAFYICQTKNKGGDCTRHSISEEVLKRIVLKEIQAYTALFVDYQMIMEELCEMKVSYDQVIGYDTQISKLQEEYNRYYSLKASLGDDLKEGLISKEEFDDFRESYGRKCEELEQMIENQKKLVKQMFEGGVSATVQLEDWKKSLEIKELDRTLLALTVDKIYIYENKQIKIHIRYQDMIEKMKVIRRFYAEHRTECRKEVG